MSRGQGLMKLVNAPFTRIQPDLCSRCVFYQNVPSAGAWADQCAKKRKLLSNPHSPTGRCKEYQDSGELVVSHSTLREWKQAGQEAQDYRKRK